MKSWNWDNKPYHCTVCKKNFKTYEHFRDFHGVENCTKGIRVLDSQDDETIPHFSNEVPEDFTKPDLERVAQIASDHGALDITPRLLDFRENLGLDEVHFSKFCKIIHESNNDLFKKIETIIWSCEFLSEFQQELVLTRIKGAFPNLYPFISPRQCVRFLYGEEGLDSRFVIDRVVNPQDKTKFGFIVRYTVDAFIQLKFGSKEAYRKLCETKTRINKETVINVIDGILVDKNDKFAILDDYILIGMFMDKTKMLGKKKLFVKPVFHNFPSIYSLDPENLSTYAIIDQSTVKQVGTQVVYSKLMEAWFEFDKLVSKKTMKIGGENVPVSAGVIGLHLDNEEHNETREMKKRFTLDMNRICQYCFDLTETFKDKDSYDKPSTVVSVETAKFVTKSCDLGQYGIPQRFQFVGDSMIFEFPSLVMPWGITQDLLHEEDEGPGSDVVRSFYRLLMKYSSLENINSVINYLAARHFVKSSLLIIQMGELVRVNSKKEYKHSDFGFKGKKAMYLIYFSLLVASNLVKNDDMLFWDHSVVKTMVLYRRFRQIEDEVFPLIYREEKKYLRKEIHVMMEKTETQFNTEKSVYPIKFTLKVHHRKHQPFIEERVYRLRDLKHYSLEYDLFKDKKVAVATRNPNYSILMKRTRFIKPFSFNLPKIEPTYLGRSIHVLEDNAVKEASRISISEKPILQNYVIHLDADCQNCVRIDSMFWSVEGKRIGYFVGVPVKIDTVCNVSGYEIVRDCSNEEKLISSDKVIAFSITEKMYGVLVVIKRTCIYFIAPEKFECGDRWKKFVTLQENIEKMMVKK